MRQYKIHILNLDKFGYKTYCGYSWRERTLLCDTLIKNFHEAFRAKRLCIVCMNLHNANTINPNEII